MRHVTRWFLATAIVVALCAPQLASAAAPKKYQVTGTVTALTDDVVTVTKPDGDKWELARDPKTVVKGELKVGAKVTIMYTMSASSIEAKKTN